jgi:hypothetical protein
MGIAPNCLARSSISSRAKIRDSNGNWAQRRSCSRRAPSKVVSRQSNAEICREWSDTVRYSLGYVLGRWLGAFLGMRRSVMRYDACEALMGPQRVICEKHLD